MTEQLDLFGVFDAAKNEEKAKENKKRAAKVRAKQRKETKPEQPKREEKKVKENLAPTWELHFFCADKAQRMAWYRAKTKDEAEVKLLREYKQAECYYVAESKRTLEEIQELD